jgi:hypothetical protein
MFRWYLASGRVRASALPRLVAQPEPAR